MRLTPICCSLLSVIAMCFSIWFVIGAFVEHRVKDLEIATFTDDFRAIKYDCDEKGINCKTVGTCMETVTSKQLEERGYHKYEDCTEDRAENLGRLASVSLHPLIYAWQNHHARNVSNKYALQFLIPTVAMPEAAWSNVYNQKTTASGTSLRFQDRLNTDELPKVNALHFYHAVDTIPHSHVPAKDGCRATYPTGVFQPEYETRLLITYNGTRTKPHDKYDTQVPVFDITEQVQCGDPAVSKNILLKDPAEWTDATQPQPTLLFSTFATVHDHDGDAATPDELACPAGSISAKAGGAITDGDMCFTQTEIDILYTHCTLQFRFLGAGASQTTTLMHDGTYGIPNVMTSPLKALSLPAALDGYYAGDGSGNDDYTTRVRLLLGTKFGDAAFAYTIILAVCAFLLADALLFLLSEVTWPERLLATYKQSAWIEARLRDLYKMRATNVLIRNERFTLSVLAAAVAFIVWGIVLRGKWGDTGSRRPICVDAFSESIEEDEDHNGWYRLTSGGWQSDHDAANYENWAILLTWFSIFALPIARYDSLIGPLFESALVEAGGIVQITGGNKKNVAAGVYANENQESSGGTWGAGLREYALLGTVNLLAAGGIIVGVVGQALMAGTYGIAWAQSVIAYYARHKTAYETPKLYASLFDQCLATGAVAITTAWVAAAAINGLAVQGVGIPSLVMYFMWVLVTVFGFLPLLLYSDLLGDPFDPDSAKEDCKVSFWDASTKTDKGADRDPGWHEEASLEGANCDTRYITYIVAVILSGLAVLIVFVFLLFTTLSAMSQTRSLNQEAQVDDAEISAARDSAKKVQITNKGQFVSNASADPAVVVVKGFGVNGVPVAAQRRAAPRLFHGVGAMGGVAGIGRAGGRAVGQAVTAVVQQIDRPTQLQAAYMTRSQTAQERHQEKLASLLGAPGAQALADVPLQAVSRR